MNHQAALSSQAVERYTLGELTSPQREEFEEHFFECPNCASALQEYEVFVANARAVFKEDATAMPIAAVPQAQPSWWNGVKGWLGAPALIPAFAALAIAFVMLRNPQQTTPDPTGEQSTWTLAAATRGAEAIPPHVISSHVVWLNPIIDLPGMKPDRWASYHWRLSTSGGNLVEEGNGHGNAPLNLKIPASKFESGKEYKLVVQGDPTTDPLVSTIVIERK